MNEEQKEAQKISAIKTLAIIGFITSIVLCVWLAVQLVRLVPSGFSSLASLAESINSREKEFIVTTEKNIINSGELFTLTWTEMKREGVYTLSYTCMDGVSAEIQTASGERAALACNTSISLPNDTSETKILFRSEKKRFTDIPFSITYTPSNDIDAATSKAGLVTIVNETYTETVVTAPVTTPQATTTPSVTATTTKPVAKPTPTTIPKQIVTTTYPVSNPSGVSDMQITYLGIGSFNEGNQTFIPQDTLEADSKGAIRFEVKNIGTKTSDSWKYEVELPDSESRLFTSAFQESLKPNERAVIIVAFNIGDARQSEELEVTITSNSDINSQNNSFSKRIEIRD
ncbi:hypothetical protein K2X96_03240 [Patescibacteria group bacterium]|nr:hypothetical protein [Patescibacteria group bacterium]